MPGKKIVNHHAAGYAQTLATLSGEIYKNILKGMNPFPKTLAEMEAALTALRKETGHTPIDTFDPFLTEDPKDPFLTENPKVDVSKLPTVHAPAVEVSAPQEEKKKSGFLGRS